MKRVLAAALVFIILLSVLAPVIASSDYEKAGKTLNQLGVLQGDGGNLMLNNVLKRQDMVVMISRLYKKEDTAKNYVGKNVFKDLTSDRKFYVPYITWAKDEGLIQGMEKDVFGFNNDTTVQEFQAVLLRALDYKEEAKDWNNIPELAKSIGIMKDLDLKPSDKLSRGQMSAMILNTLKENKRGQSITLGEVLSLDVPGSFEIVDSKITINENMVFFEGKVRGSKSLKLYIRPTSQGVSQGEKLEDVFINNDGEFVHVIKDMEKGSYEYRFEGDSGKTEIKTLKVE
ncbi:MAG: S-layer homology domain-containing protein [Tissierellaceae bacterium]